MEAIVIPESTPHFTIRHTLDGREYVLDFEWSEREGAWYARLADQAGVPIVGATRLVADWPLWLSVNDARMFRGALVALDTSGQGLDPTLTDFGSRVLLAYAAPGEIP